MMILDDLNKAQREAVTYDQGPMLILAGAGSGKTRVLTYKAAYLMKEKQVAPENIMLTTFTNKAAEEMQMRLERLAGFRIPFAGTFHSLCARMLRRHGEVIGIDRDYSIYDTADQLEVIKEVFKELRLDSQAIKPRSVLYTIEQAKHELITPSQYAGYARGSYQQQAARAYTRYQQMLREAHALDFNDLLLKALDLLQENTEVRHFYQQKLEYVLVDEYQDTNTAQYNLTKLLAQPQRQLCVVGDASQAIYSWRGANYKNLQALERDFPDLKVFRLEQNYRSTPQILKAASGVVGQNQLHPILDLWTEREAGTQVQVVQARDEYEEVSLIIKALLQKPEEKTYADYAVLYRTNAQSRIVEELLVRNGIPYQLVGGVKFYERKEIKDVLSYIRYTFNQQDRVSLERITKLGKRRLGAFLEWLSLAQMERRPGVLLDEILKVTAYLDKFDPEDVEDASRIDNVQELRNVAEGFETLAEFLENVALVERETHYSGNQDEGAVTLMTLHASKGLEFAVVFMIGLEEGLFPHARAIMSREELEEERRLCYVGMTRAGEKLILSYATTRLYFGSRSHNPVSRFVGEIPQEVMEVMGAGEGEYLSLPKPSKPISDEVLEKFLRDEIDIDEFLRN